MIAVIAAALVASATAAADADPTSDKQALVILRVLSYDRQLARRARARVVIAVVRDDGDLASRRAAGIMAGALRGMSSGLTVAGKPISVVEISANQLFADRLRALEVTAVYLPGGLDGELEAVTAAARARPCLTFTDRPTYLRRGVAVALGTDVARKRITLAVDLAAARAQGASLSAELLRVARVVNR
jgi:hypothetical protein